MTKKQIGIYLTDNWLMFSSEHYGTEIHIFSEPTDKSELYKLLEQVQDYALIHEYTL